MSQGIFNFEIEKVFKEINNDDLNKNYLGVFRSDKINKFAMFEKKMSGKKYLSIISNTDKSDESTRYCWSILNISSKNDILLFDLLGVTGMKRFIVQADKKVVGKVLKGIELADRKDNKTLVKLTFSMNDYDRLTEKEIKKLPGAAQDFFHPIHSFGWNQNITNFVNVWMLEGLIQLSHSMTCGPFQIYFCKNLLFFPTRNANYTITVNLQTPP